MTYEELLLQNSNPVYLFVNLGSPKNLTISSVRKYLKEFLTDKRVIDVPFYLRYLIVYAFILPFRPKQTLEKYKKIWNYKINQSPLLLITEQMIAKLRSKLPDITIDYAMRYGSPSIKEKLNFYYQKGVRRVHVIPLYPQYATSTYGSVVSEVCKQNQKFWDPMQISFEPPFYDEKDFINLWIQKINQIKDFYDYYVVFSFHGVPVRHIQKSDLLQQCLKDHCCINPKEYCYKSQTFYISNVIAKELKIKHWSIAYQSRLGKSEWIRPYLEEEIQRIAQTYKKILIVPLSFVADCLETLEELKLTLVDTIKNIFFNVEILVLDSLNSEESWITFWEKKILKKKLSTTDF